MDTNFSKVSLGFAEFVSQLVHETFDAIVDSQNYQLEKYLELEEALATSSEDLFRSKYVSEEEIQVFILKNIGFSLSDHNELIENQMVLLREVAKSAEIDDSGLFQNKKLTPLGVDTFERYFIGKLIASKRTRIQMLVSKPELTRLFVNEGEINAKLDLFFLNREDNNYNNGDQNNSGNNPKDIPKSNPIGTDHPVFPKKELNISKEVTIAKDSPILYKSLEIVDKETGLKTVILNKEQIKNSSESTEVDTVRLIANPVSNTTSGKIFSEITLKLKSY